MKLKQVQDGKEAKGKIDLISHLSGRKLIRSKAVKAKCFECMCGYADGKADCKIESCPLHPFMPYRGKS